MNTKQPVKPPFRGGLIKRLLAIPRDTLDYVKGKTSGLILSSKMAEHGSAIRIDRDLITSLTKALNQQLKSIAPPNPHQTLQPTEQEQTILRSIATETQRLNRNNTTRTQAYLYMYRRYPELHWALLAHMVSRNGGWNMTDLRGEWLPALMTKPRTEVLFGFLERANALIFQDAYPQLLLYEASRMHDRDLFHLLPKLHISAYMTPVWKLFWEHRCSELLTVCLIINEQHYIEGRVVQQEPYRTLLQSWFMQAQTLLQLNVIAFPYKSELDPQQPPRLAGLVLESFSDLTERIAIGKKLYAMLFGVPAILEGARLFAASTPHTGSRSDYWSHLFAAIKEAPPRPKVVEKLDGCALMAGADRLYSPKLENAWKDRPVEPPDRYDWFQDLTPLAYVGDIDLPRSFEITNEYCFALNKLELAALAGQQLPD